MSYLKNYYVHLEFKYYNRMPIISLGEILMFDTNGDIIKDKDIINNSLNKINYKDDDNITFYDDDTQITQTYKSESIHGFTDRELFDCILKFEQLSRPHTDWNDSGEMDTIHTFFEGIKKINWVRDFNMFEIHWS